MIRVCPLPLVWAKIHRELSRIATKNLGVPLPPVPLILAGWNFSDDFEKNDRWESTVEWTKKFGGEELISTLKSNDYYCVDQFTRPAFFDYQWGETSPPGVRPADDELTNLIEKISIHWDQIAEVDSAFTRPLNFAGAKARSLIVEFDTNELPSWGTWGNEPGGYHNQRFTNKASFTALRQRINDAIQPHKIDHVVFQRKK
jgi:hypothetical protein